MKSKEPGQLTFEAWSQSTRAWTYLSEQGKEHWAAVETAIRTAALEEAADEIERLRSVAQTAFGLLWQDRHTEEHIPTSAEMVAMLNNHGIKREEG